MKFLLKYFLLAVVFAGAFFAYSGAFPQNASAAGCTFSISPTTIAPHGDFTVDVQNLTVGNPSEYVIVYDSSSFFTVWTATATNYSVTVNVDQIFGANSPQALGGSFQIAVGTVQAVGQPGGEICSAIGGNTVTVDLRLTPPPTVNLSANPTSISSGGSSTLTWSSTNTTSCTASGSWSGTKPLSGSQSTGSLTGPSSYTYTLTCIGPSGSASRSVTVSVAAPPPPPPPTVSLSANPTSISSGGSSTLTWSSTNTTSCTASGSWSGTKPLSGSQSTGSLTGPASYTYTLICTGPGGSDSKSVPVSVLEPPLQNNFPPIGFLDGPGGDIDCSVTTQAWGWAFDPDRSWESINVHIYVDGGAGSGASSFAVTANRPRPDVNLAYNVTGNHGFVWDLPGSLKDGNTHTLYAYGIDLSGGGPNPDLSASPRSFRCSNVAPPPPPPSPPVGEPIGGSGPTRGFSCIVSGRSFNIAECFHPARIIGYETSAGFGFLATDILLILTGLAGGLSMIFIVIAGIKFVTSGGDSKKLQTSPSTITYAIVGLAVTILAFVILRIVQFFLRSSVPGL